MTYDKFRELVRSMREAQKEYFRVRGYAALSESKRLEREVDKELINQNEPDLFETHNQNERK